MANEEQKVTVIKATAKLVDRNRPTGAGKRMRVAAYARVSTDKDEQKESFQTQVNYYTDLIRNNPEWNFAGVYADEGISGAHADNRPQFMKMINDAMAGRIDIILMKSVSRMGRNTLDNIKYIRMLKSKGISIRFEEEHVDSLSGQGDFMMTIMSSIAQQELENTSAHVKKSLKMKMQHGELVGFQSCLGYDYDKATKSIVVNEEEAKTINYIFRRYIEGAGCSTIAKELENRHIKTKYGHSGWHDTGVLGIIKNEKYKGDLLQGKTFTVDPITKKRLKNMGEEEQILIENHHPAIVSKEIWDKANDIRIKRNFLRARNDGGKVTRYSRAFPMSSMLQCGFCGHVLTRRTVRGSVNYHKDLWVCVSYAKHGKSACPYCKAIDEKTVEGAFVEVFNAVYGDDSDVLDEFIKIGEDSLLGAESAKKRERIDKDISEANAKMSKATEFLLAGNLAQDAYDATMKECKAKIAELEGKRDKFDIKSKGYDETRKRLDDLKAAVKENGGKKLKQFSPLVFSACVEEVIVGGFKADKKPDPYRLVFVFKTGEKIQLDNGVGSACSPALFSSEELTQLPVLSTAEGTHFPSTQAC